MSEHLTYPGDLRGQDLTGIIGKDKNGRRVGARKVEYDPETDTTIVTLKGVTPAEYRELIEPLFIQARERERLKGFFGG